MSVTSVKICPMCEYSESGPSRAIMLHTALHIGATFLLVLVLVMGAFVLPDEI